jgi:hypothetical protein
VWCGVVWCGVVWCGVVWCGVVSHLKATANIVPWPGRSTAMVRNESDSCDV